MACTVTYVYICGRMYVCDVYPTHNLYSVQVYKCTFVERYPMGQAINNAYSRCMVARQCTSVILLQLRTMKQ